MADSTAAVLPKGIAPQNCVIIIPARMNSTRLPGKVLADIGGLPMLIHAARRAQAAQCGAVIIATDHAEIMEAAAQHGFAAIMTAEQHQSGSDRIYEALQKTDLQKQYDIIINVQGDLPTINPADIAAAVMPLADSQVDIATLCAATRREEEKTNPNAVKLVGSRRTPLANGCERLRALYFTRASAPYGEGVLYHHIGLYVYRRRALERFVQLPPSALEQREKLEQLRALEADMRIDAAVVNSMPLGVDTAADLEYARRYIAQEAAYNAAKQQEPLQ